MLADSIKAVKAAETEAAQIIADAKAKAEDISRQAEDDVNAVLKESEKRARIAEKDLLEMASQKAAAHRNKVEMQTKAEAEELRKAAAAAEQKAIAAIIEEIV